MVTPDSSQPEDYADLVDTQEKGRNYLFYIVIVVFVLAVVGYFSLPSPEPEIELEAPLSQEEIDPVVRAQIEASQQAAPATEPAAGLPQAESQAGAPESVTQQPAESAPAPQPETGQPPGEAARALIAAERAGEQSLTLEQMYHQAAEYQQQEMIADAYLLYFYTARKGYGPAAFELARMHDPAHFVGGSDLLDQPDPVQAYKWYSSAAAQGVTEAAQALEALRNSVEAAAQAGDLSAQRLLLNWN